METALVLPEDQGSTAELTPEEEKKLQEIVAKITTGDDSEPPRGRVPIALIADKAQKADIKADWTRIEKFLESKGCRFLVGAGIVFLNKW